MRDLGTGQEIGGTRRGRSAFLAWVTCAFLVVGVAAWSSEASWANAQTSTITTTAATPGQTSPLGQIGEQPGWATELPQLLTKHEENVQTGRPLEIIAFVHEPDGTPVRNASVLFEWRAASGRYLMRDRTDYRGIARTRRWISTRERGYTNQIRVSVDTATWSAERYAWFVPK